MLKTILAAGALTAVALPATACDFHGPNGMFWTPMHNWQNFSPKTSTTDPNFFNDEEDPAFLGDITGQFEVAPPAPRKVRPSFFSAADKASRAAKARVMMMGQSDDADISDMDASADAPETIAVEDTSDADTQPIR